MKLVQDYEEGPEFSDVGRDGPDLFRGGVCLLSCIIIAAVICGAAKLLEALL